MGFSAGPSILKLRLSSRMLGAAVALLAAAVVFCVSLGNRPFYSRGEAREALVVSAMVRQQNYILPARSGSDVPSKPPMFHWLASSAVDMHGQPDEFAIRLPSAIAAGGVVAVTFFIITAVAPPAFAAGAVLLLASAFEFSRSATHARVDMCFTFFLTIVFAALFYLLPRARTTDVTACGAIALVLGTAGAVLSKGPAGVVFPLGSAAMYILYTEVYCGPRAVSWKLRVKTALCCRRTALIVSCCLFGTCIAAIWYYQAYLQGGSKFLYTQLFKENVGRMVEVDGESPGHVKPFYFSFIDLLTGFLPWSILFPIFGYCAYSRSQRQIADAQPLHPEARRLCVFSAAWTGTLLCLVCLSLSKRPVYLLPAFPPIAFLTAMGSAEFFRRPAFARTVRGCTYAVACVVVILLTATLIAQNPNLGEAIVSSTVRHNRTREDVMGILHSFGVGGAAGVISVSVAVVLLVVLTGVLLRYRRKSAPQNELAYVATVVIAITAIANAFVLPPIAARSDAREFIKGVARTVPETSQIYAWKDSFYAPAYYAEQIIGKSVQSVKSAEQLDRRAKAYVLVGERDLRDEELQALHAPVLLRSAAKAANGEGMLALIEVPAAGLPQPE